MSLFRRFSVVVVAFVLAGTSPALAQDMPDDATRAHVAEWLDQCSRRASDACMPVIKRIEDSPMFGWCQAIEWQWDAARLVRDPENALHSFEEALGWREKALEFIAKCVPIYAAALREIDERDDSSDDTAYHGPVEAADRVMQAVKRSNLRSGPGTTYGKVGLLDIGDEVRVTGVVGDWLRIAASDGGEAFIYGPLLAEVTPDQVTTADEREPEPASDTVAVTETVGAQDMPDAATRERVADWIERCDRPSDACWPVIERIRESARGRWCREAEYQLDTVRVVRDPENAPYFVEEAYGRLEKAKDFIEECVPIYVAALDDDRVFVSEEPDTGVASIAQAEGRPAEVATATPAPTRPVREEPSDSAGSSAGTGPLHGSIAFSQEDDGAYAWGIAWSYDSSVGAESEAIGQCREYGGTRCAEAGWFQEACGALAIGGGNGYGTGWGATTAEAERDALRQCRAANDDCRIEVARCSQSEEAGGSGRTETSADVKVRIEPKCVDLVDTSKWSSDGTYCFAEFRDPSGCWRQVFSLDWPKVNMTDKGATGTWSGPCANGLANGEGTMFLDYDGQKPFGHFYSSSEQTGTMVDGKRHGLWEFITRYRNGLVSERTQVFNMRRSTGSD